MTSQEIAKTMLMIMMVIPREKIMTLWLRWKMMKKWLRLLIQEIPILILIWEMRTMKMIMNNLMGLKVRKRRLKMTRKILSNWLSLKLAMRHQLTINKNCWTREVHRMILKIWSTPLPSHILRSEKFSMILPSSSKKSILKSLIQRMLQNPNSNSHRRKWWIS